MSTSLALNDGAAAPAGAEQPEKQTKTKKKAKHPKLTKAEKQAAKAEKNAEKAEAKAAKKEAKRAEKKAAAVAAAAASQEPSSIGLQSHVQRPTVPPPPPRPVRPALDAVHDAILHSTELHQAEQQTADVIASIHDDMAALKIDGSRSITRHLIQHVREHRVNLEVDVAVDPRLPARAPEVRRFADDASVSRKVACELYSQAQLLRRPIFVNNGVRDWEVKEGRCPGCRKCCKKCWYGPCRRSRHLLTVYMSVVFVLSCVLALVDHSVVPLVIFALWLLPGLWTPAMLVKGLCCAACRDTHGVVTLEWRVQTLFWFGLWVLPVLLFFVPIAASRHAASFPALRWAAFGASLGSLWLLGWVVHWVETVSKGVNKTSHDRYRQILQNSIASAGPNTALEADALEAERVRRWPRRLPYGFAYRRRAIVLEGLFACSVTFLPAVPWAEYLQQLELSEALGLPDAVADRLRPDLLFRVVGMLDASAVTELAGVDVPFLHLILHGLVILLALLAPVATACLRRRTKEEREVEAKQREEAHQMMQITIKGKKTKKGKTKRPPRTAQPPASVLTHRVLSIGAQTKTVTYLCEMLALPILFHLLEPFFCTEQSVLSAATNISCIDTATEDGIDSVSAECMDGDPSVQCWTLKHMGMYVLPSILVLPSYYMRAVRDPVKFIRKQTVLDLSPRYMITSLQLKVILAVAALVGRLGGGSSVGSSDGFPWRSWILIAGVEVYAVVLLLMCVDSSGKLTAGSKPDGLGTTQRRSRCGEVRWPQCICSSSSSVYMCCTLSYSSIVDLTWLNRASLLWTLLQGALAAFLLASGENTSSNGWTLKTLPVEMQSAPMYALCLCLLAPWLRMYSQLRCWCCEKRLPSMVPTLAMHDRPELVDYPIVAARWSAYKALLEQGRLEVVARQEAEAAKVAAAEAAKVAAAEAAMKRAAELFSGRRVLRECFVVWKLEAKTYDDTVWQGLVQLGTIDFKTFKQCTSLEARKEYMATHERANDLKARAEASDHAQDAKQEDDSAAATGAVFFSSAWSETIKGASIVISGTNKCSAMQTGQYTSVWCDDPLPSKGKHYWEIRFEQPGAKSGDWTLRDAYFVGVVNHSKVDENGAGFSKGAWGIVPYNDDRALRSDGMDAGAVPKPGRNELGNIFGSGDRVGVLADMDARPRTLQFYRNRTLIKGAKVSGVAGNVRILACPYNRGMSVSIAFSPPVEKLARFRADLFAAMKPEAPEGRLAQSIADCELAGVPETDEEMIEAKQMQAELDEKQRLIAEREEQRKLTVAALGDAGTGAALKEIVDPEQVIGEPEPPAWLEEVSDDEDDRDDEPTPWDEEVFELRLSELGAPAVVSGAASASSGDVTTSSTELHSLLYEYTAETAAGGEPEGGRRQIEQMTLEMVLCKPVHIAQRDDSAGPRGSKDSKLGRQRCRCTSRSVRKGCRFCKCFTCKCSCCCGDCCQCCERVDLHPVPKVRVVGVDIATAGGQRFISLLQRIKVDQDREGCSRWLRLGLCRCLSCGCVSRRKALGVDLIEVRFNLPELCRKQFWLETGWGPEMKRAVAAVKALEGKGKNKCNGGKGIRISRAPLDSVMHLEEALLKVKPSADAAIRAMMRTLPGSAVTELRLRRNGLTDRALRSIARGLRFTVISELYLAHNQIGDNGCIALAAALPGSRVKKVDLSANRVGDDGALALAAVAWRGTSQLQEIMLYDNKSITKVGLSALESACDHRRQLRQRDKLVEDVATETSTDTNSTTPPHDAVALGKEIEPLALTDGDTTVGLGEQPRPVLLADDAAAGDSQTAGQHAPLYVAVAYASTPRHVDGRPVAGSRTLRGAQVLSNTGAAWDAKYTRAGLQLR